MNSSVNDIQYLEAQISSLERLIKKKTSQGYKSEDLSEEIHDLAILKEQLNKFSSF